LKHFRFKQTGEPLAVLTLEDAPTPTPGDYDVLVRMLLAPIHPSDLHVLRGRFRQPQLPATPGLEGMGEIEADRLYT
jgi:NADPH:quinone reductase-like Zn-dependent oxidoreductase